MGEQRTLPTEQAAPIGAGGAALSFPGTAAVCRGTWVSNPLYHQLTPGLSNNWRKGVANPLPNTPWCISHSLFLSGKWNCKIIWIFPFASDLCPGEIFYPFPGAVQVTIWPQKYNSKHSPVFQPKTNLLSFPTWQLNKYFVLTIWKGEPQQRGFVHCSYKHQPCLQIKPEQVAQREHIYSTNVTPFCSESTTSSLQLLIYLSFAIVQQAILAIDCFLDLPDIFLTSVSDFYFVDADSCLKVESLRVKMTQPVFQSDHPAMTALRAY